MSRIKKESRLVAGFSRLIKLKHKTFGHVSIAHEFDYSEGRTDVVALNDEGDVIAFEAKLTRWRDALHQAYRNGSFAHFSYVLLPRLAADLALRREHEFHKRRVGLCVLEGDEVLIEIPATRIDRLHPWLTEAARQYATR